MNISVYLDRKAYGFMSGACIVKAQWPLECINADPCVLINCFNPPFIAMVPATEQWHQKIGPPYLKAYFQARLDRGLLVVGERAPDQAW